MSKLKDRISSFFIFNSTFGPKEGEELKRILYYHPPQVDVDSRKNQVGLCEAIVQFMLNFTTEPCEAMFTQDKRTILYQPEKEYYMVMVVKNEAPTAATSTELRGEKIPTQVINDLLIAAYDMFRLFMGAFSKISQEDVYQKCETFFTPYLSEMHLRDNVSDIIQGIDYLPLDKSSFFKVLCLIDLLDIEYPILKCVAFLYNDRLMWNSLATQNLLAIYKYLVCRLIPKQEEKERLGGAVTSAQVHGRYVSPAGGITTEDDLKCIHKINLSGGNEQDEQHYFIAYRAHSLTICFTVKCDTMLRLESFRSLDAFIGPHLSSLATHISKHVPKSYVQTSPSTDAKFVYFNRLNLAFKSSLDTNKLVTSSLMKPEVLNIISEMRQDKESLGSYGEIIMKTTDDYWITGKISNEREFYVVIQQKNANLKEISDEVKQICDAQMKDIFFYPK